MGSSVLSLALIFNSICGVFAEDYVVPLPKDKVILTGDNHTHDSYLKDEGYRLDFQAAEIPEGIDLGNEKKESRCYSYGMPILAARDGKVIRQTTSAKQRSGQGYGAHIALEHDDGSRSYYAHMISDTNDKYVNLGDEVKAGQILGLMGDTGFIIPGDANNPCIMDGNNGTHLHFESVSFASGSKKSVNPEPLGGYSGFERGKIINSQTNLFDPKGAYFTHHANTGYPYKLNISEVYSITPLQAQTGRATVFNITGKNFFEGMSLDLPFCGDEKINFISSSSASITCTPTGSGLQEGTFPNTELDGNILKFQVEVKDSTPNLVLRIDEVNFISPKPGEIADLNIRGANLPGDLYVMIKDKQARKFSPATGCTNEKGSSLLSPGSIQTGCRLPLNIGPVNTESTREFDILIFRNKVAHSNEESPLYTSEFSSNFGISAATLKPRKASYYLPTRFTISGKNVHRTTIFYIEGCASEDMSILEQVYDKVVIECLIQPKPDTDLGNIEGKTFKHSFLFKTQSRRDDEGNNILTDEEDRANTVLSGVIEMAYDMEQRIDSIEPQEAVIGTETVFTVTGNNLPYTDDSERKPLVWLAHCASSGSNRIEIIPDSYTPNGFDFACTPQFDNANPSPDFDISTAEQECDFILEKPWNEVQKNAALEKCYESNDRRVKQSMWDYFDQFFENLTPRPLHVKDLQEGNNKELVSSQEVRFVTALYDLIQKEERFQFQYTRQDGSYSTGTPAVNKVMVNSISSTDRHQSITVSGQNLPKSFAMDSEDCAQIATTYGSSERFEFVCLLKKVAVEELRFLDLETGNELHRTLTDVLEVYETFLQPSNSPGHVIITLQGVNLEPEISISSEDCQTIQLLDKAHSSESSYLCKTTGGEFSTIRNLRMKVLSKDGVLLFDGESTERKKSTSVNEGTLPDTKIPLNANNQQTLNFVAEQPSEETPQESNQSQRELDNTPDDESLYNIEWEYPLKKPDGSLILYKHANEYAYAYLQIDDLNDVNLDYKNYKVSYSVGGITQNITLNELTKITEKNWELNSKAAYLGNGKIAIRIPSSINRGQLKILSINGKKSFKGSSSVSIQASKNLAGEVTFTQEDSRGAEAKLAPWAALGGSYNTRGKLNYSVENQQEPSQFSMDIESADGLTAKGSLGAELSIFEAKLSAEAKREKKSFSKYDYKNLSDFSDIETFKAYQDLMDEYQLALDILDEFKSCNDMLIVWPIYDNEDCQAFEDIINQGKADKNHYESVINKIRQGIFADNGVTERMTAMYHSLQKGFSIENDILFENALKKLRLEPFMIDERALKGIESQQQYGSSIAIEAALGAEIGADLYVAEASAEGEVKGIIEWAEFNKHPDGLDEVRSSSQGRSISSSLQFKIPENLLNKINPIKAEKVSRMASKFLTRLKKAFPKEGAGLTQGKVCKFLKQIFSNKGALSQNNYSDDCRGLHMVMTAAYELETNTPTLVSEDDIQKAAELSLGFKIPEKIATFMAATINSTDIDFIDILTGSWPLEKGTQQILGRRNNQLIRVIYEVTYKDGKDYMIDRFTFYHPEDKPLPTPEEHFFISDRLDDYLILASNDEDIFLHLEKFKSTPTIESERDISFGWGISAQMTNTIQHEIMVPLEDYGFDRDGNLRLLRKTEEASLNSISTALENMASKDKVGNAHLQSILQNLAHILIIAVGETELLSTPIDPISKTITIN